MPFVFPFRTSVQTGIFCRLGLLLPACLLPPPPVRIRCMHTPCFCWSSAAVHPHRLIWVWCVHGKLKYHQRSYFLMPVSAAHLRLWHTGLSLFLPWIHLLQFSNNASPNCLGLARLNHYRPVCTHSLQHFCFPSSCLCNHSKKPSSIRMPSNSISVSTFNSGFSTVKKTALVLAVAGKIF